MTKYNSIVFDMDGVLTDTEKCHLIAFQKVFGPHEIEINEDNWHYFVGKSGNATKQVLIDEFNANFDEKEYQELRVTKRELMPKILSKHAILMPYAKELLENLSKNNIKLALASQSTPDEINATLKTTGLEKYFEIKVSGFEMQKPKPLPDVYLKAAEMINKNPKECIAIEDSNAGVVSANTAGLYVVAVPNKYTASHDFSNAHERISSLNEFNMGLLK